MFDSIYSTTVTSSEFFIMAAVAIVSGFIYSLIMSFRIQTSKRFLIVTSLIPFIVASIITFVNGNIGAGVAIGGAFGLIRFRSAQGTSEEISAILIAVGSGIAFGMGYVAYGVIILIALAAVFLIISFIPVFDRQMAPKDKILRITIPESIDYYDLFNDTFSHYLSYYESLEVKTTAMGSMFRLSYKIRMKNPKEEKEFIDEIRTMNGNLEIALLPYSENQIHL